MRWRNCFRFFWRFFSHHIFPFAVMSLCDGWMRCSSIRAGPRGSHHINHHRRHDTKSIIQKKKWTNNNIIRKYIILMWLNAPVWMWGAFVNAETSHGTTIFISVPFRFSHFGISVTEERLPGGRKLHCKPKSKRTSEYIRCEHFLAHRYRSLAAATQLSWETKTKYIYEILMLRKVLGSNLIIRIRPSGIDVMRDQMLFKQNSARTHSLQRRPERKTSFIMCSRQRQKASMSCAYTPD